MKKNIFFLLIFFLAGCSIVQAQVQDSLPQHDTASKSSTDSVIKPTDKKSAYLATHIPRKATLRSAILPGWGQAYNKEYWKIPIVYGALAIPTVTYIYNNKWYKKTRDAYNIVVNQDSAHFGDIDPKLQGLISNPESLQFYRNQFRKDRDYSTLWFFIVWGLNVVDATVFAHLKHFDVSDNLSMEIQPKFDPRFKTPGLGLVFNIKYDQAR